MGIRDTPTEQSLSRLSHTLAMAAGMGATAADTTVVGTADMGAMAEATGMEAVSDTVDMVVVIAIMGTITADMATDTDIGTDTAAGNL
ncbi:MAG: hypothetical protein JWN70_7206 [Planctomycetaceae bacterium]|nr:hypothetical protein [Planctomycetaceae bacterium]